MFLASSRFLTPVMESSSIEQILEMVLKQIQTLDLTEAESSLREALERYPDEGRFWELLGTVLWCDGDQKEALAAIETASAYRTLSPFSQLILADCYTRLGKQNLAFMILYFLSEEDRCPIDVMPQLAAQLGRLHAYYLAYTVCERLVERVPQHHAAWFGMSYYLLREGHPLKAALPSLRRAFELHPFHLTYRVSYGLALAELGDVTQALALLVQVHPHRVSCMDCLKRLSLFFQQRGDSIRAELFQARILELSIANL